MVQSKPVSALLTEDTLPETDHRPVDNELQVLLPILLRAILSLLWADRADWFMGVNLGLYDDPAQAAIGSDAFLSLGVPRYKRPRGRLSYVLAQEKVVPQWVLEMVSQTPGGEYDDKFQKYAAIGILYYTIYNPDYAERDGHDPFEVYRLENGVYVR
jgi:Uma2 family endonuclease